MTPISGLDPIAEAFSSVGIPAWRLVSKNILSAIAEISDPGQVDRYGLTRAAGAVVAALPYDPRAPGQGAGDEPGGPPPYLTIGAFASRNRYAALARLLRSAGRLAAAAYGVPASGFRTLVNSRIPEKPLAAMAGLGFLGRSSLLVSDDYGPACVLGVLLLPPDAPITVPDAPIEAWRLREGSGCGPCAACVASCPTGAIRALPGPPAAGSLAADECLQYWSTKPGAVPPRVLAAWGSRLYGCDACVLACPRSAGAFSDPSSRAEALLLPAERKPGPLVSTAFMESAGDDELRAYFKKTALGMSWIGIAELRRNAALGAGAAAGAGTPGRPGAPAG